MAVAAALSSSTTITSSSAVDASPEAAADLSPSTTITSSSAVDASPKAAADLSPPTTINSTVAASPEAAVADLSPSTTINSAVASSPEAAADLSPSTTTNSSAIAASPEATDLSIPTAITSAVASSPEEATILSSPTTITSAVAASPEEATILSSPTTITSAVAASPEAATSALSPSNTISSAVAASPEAASSSAIINSAVAASPTTKPRLRGVVFDMDGTLTVPVIDFQAMHKAVLGDDEYVAVKSKSPAGIDILRHVENWSPEKRQKAYEIIVDYERQGLDRLQIMPGASELCDFLNSRNIRRGLITRNFKESVDFFHQRFGMEFTPAVSREFCLCKPDPAPLLHICTEWKISSNEVMMIGDSLKDDVGCGKRAGAYACLLDQTGKYDGPEYANVEYKPDYKVSSLAEVCSLLEANFDVTPCNSLQM